MEPLSEWLQLDRYISGQRRDSADDLAADDGEEKTKTPRPPKTRLHARLDNADALMSAKIKQVTDRVADKASHYN